MELDLKLKGFMICVMIGLSGARPQYNYQSSSSSNTLSLASNLGGGLHNTQIMQILPSHNLAQTYLPPGQQIQPIAAQPLISSAVPANQYIPPTQSFSSSIASGQQIFKDISQLPLQNTPNHVFSGQSNSYQGLVGQTSSVSGGQAQSLSNGFRGQAQSLTNGFSGQAQSLSNGFSGQAQSLSKGFSGQAQSLSNGFSGQAQSLSNGFSGQAQSLSNGLSGQSLGISGGLIGQSRGVSNVFNGNSQGLVGQSNSLSQQAAFRPQQKTIVTKDIFVHTAPPDAEDEQEFNKQLQSVPIRKNYRIIFIKAPEQNLRVAAAALRQVQAINQEKTVIYVLSKKSDISELQKEISQIQAPQTINQKPEVYFIKYKTNEEALRAQQEIQAQYDKLGGSTSISNEGIAQIIGAPNSNLGSISTSGSTQTGSISAPAQQYLPAKV